MPKIKTHKSTSKRIKKRANNQLKRRNAYATHLMSSKSVKRKRAFRKSEPVSPANMANVKRGLGLK